jgi:hypothetical protein
MVLPFHNRENLPIAERIARADDHDTAPLCEIAPTVRTGGAPSIICQDNSAKDILACWRASPLRPGKIVSLLLEAIGGRVGRIGRSVLVARDRCQSVHDGSMAQSGALSCPPGYRPNIVAWRQNNKGARPHPAEDWLRSLRGRALPVAMSARPENRSRLPDARRALGPARWAPRGGPRGVGPAGWARTGMRSSALPARATRRDGKARGRDQECAAASLPVSQPMRARLRVRPQW